MSSQQTLACPECDKGGINSTPGPYSDTDYVCSECGHSFDDPVKRECRHECRPRASTTARDLIEADPGDLGGGE